MQLHLVILILKFTYLGDGNQMLPKGIFALIAFHTNQHYANCHFRESSLVTGWNDKGLSGRAVCRGNCSALGFGDTLFSQNIVACITCFNLSQESAGTTAGIDMDHTQVVLTSLA